MVLPGLSTWPSTCNTFFGYYDKGLLCKTSKSVLYFRNIDDIFDIFNKAFYCDSLFSALNFLHPCLTLLLKKKVDGKLFFRDFLAQKADLKFFTSIYPKPILLDNTYIEILLDPKTKKNVIGTLCTELCPSTPSLDYHEGCTTSKLYFSKRATQTVLFREVYQGRCQERRSSKMLRLPKTFLVG